MADVYLSYANADREAAREATRRIEAAGFSVWTNSDLNLGDRWQQQLEHEFSAARAVIVLWSGISKTSRWVTSEVARAIHDKKVVLHFAVYTPAEKFVPPEFQTEHVHDNFEVLVSDLKRSLGPPTRDPASTVAPHRPSTSRGNEAPAPPERDVVNKVSFREWRLTAIYWLGIGSAVLTLAGNLETFLKLARWIRLVFANWSEILTLLWRAIIPWHIQIGAEDAVILTLIVVLFFNLLITSRPKDVEVRSSAKDPLLLVTGGLLIAYVGFVGFAERYDEAAPGLVASIVSPLVSQLHQINFSGWDEAASFISVLVVGVAAMLAAYVPFALALGLRPNPNAYSVRLWRILFGLGIAIVINQVSLFFESPEWTRIFTS